MIDAHVRIEQKEPNLFEVHTRAQVDGVEFWLPLGHVTWEQVFAAPTVEKFKAYFVSPFQTGRGPWVAMPNSFEFETLKAAVDWLWIKREELLEAGPPGPDLPDSALQKQGRAGLGRGLSWDQIAEMANPRSNSTQCEWLSTVNGVVTQCTLPAGTHEHVFVGTSIEPGRRRATLAFVERQTIEGQGPTCSLIGCIRPEGHEGAHISGDDLSRRPTADSRRVNAEANAEANESAGCVDCGAPRVVEDIPFCKDCEPE